MKTISAGVNLRPLGYPRYPGTSHGAPVEAAFSPDGRYGYLELLDVRLGVRAGGSDECTPSSGVHNSFVYRIDMERLRIDAPTRWEPYPRSSR